MDFIKMKSYENEEIADDRLGLGVSSLGRTAKTT